MASKTWQAANREKRRYQSDRSAAKRFLRTCTDRDLDELETLVRQERTKREIVRIR